MFTQMYCSEQIQIPPDLPAILKAYCKAVYKETQSSQNKSDLIAFSIKYFKEQLDNPPNSAAGYRVTLSDFHDLQENLMTVKKLNQTLKRVDYQVACEKLGFSPEILANILRLGFPDEDVIDLYKFMGIGATLLSANFESSITNLFKIFEDQNCQAKLPTQALIDFVTFLQSKDPNIPSSFLEKLKASATEEMIDLTMYKRIFAADE